MTKAVKGFVFVSQKSETLPASAGKYAELVESVWTSTPDGELRRPSTPSVNFA